MTADATCRSCGAAIVFLRTPAGRWLPVDPYPDPEHGNVADLGDGRCEVLGPEAKARHRGPLYRSHWSSCPSASSHRRQRVPARQDADTFGGEGGGA